MYNFCVNMQILKSVIAIHHAFLFWMNKWLSLPSSELKNESGVLQAGFQLH